MTVNVLCQQYGINQMLFFKQGMWLSICSSISSTDVGRYIYLWQEEEKGEHNRLSFGSAKELHCSVPLKRMELIFICKADLKQSPTEWSQEGYQFEKVSPLSFTISNWPLCSWMRPSQTSLQAGAARFGPEALRDGSLWGWAVLPAWVTERQRHSSLG